MTIGEKPVVADAAKAIGQDVEQEAADELAGCEHHRFIFQPPVFAIILPTKCNMLICQFDEPAIPDGDMVGIACEISQHLLWPREWALGVDHPLAFVEGRETGQKRGAIGVRREVVEELELAGIEERRETFEEQSAEET